MLPFNCCVVFKPKRLLPLLAPLSIATCPATLTATTPAAAQQQGCSFSSLSYSDYAQGGGFEYHNFVDQ
jgi:hypothetical protein